MASPKFTLHWWPAALLALSFSAICCALLPYPGIQNDEAFFAGPYVLTGSSIFHFSVLGREVPVMFMSYMGALKTWICAPLLLLAPPSIWALRLPPVIFGAATVWLFMKLLGRAHGQRAAWIGGLLLATDTMFALTTCFDWGPVALQHLLLVLGALLILHFALDSRRVALFFGFLCFGLALWDKALFIWTLGGLTLAALAIFPYEIPKRLTLRNIGLAAGGLCLGSLPLIAYNVSSGFTTWRSNTSLDFRYIPGKAKVLLDTWQGTALLNFVVAGERESGEQHEARGLLERASFALHSAAGERRRNRLDWAFGAALLLVAVLWKRQARRMLLAALLALAAAWIQMAITRNAGASAHHAVLLWPIPHFILAVTFAEASLRWRRVGAVVVVASIAYLAVENLLVTNQYLYQMVRFGSVRGWTDASYGLANELTRMPAEHVVVEDWGILNPLALLSRGALPLAVVDETFLTSSRGGALRDWDRRLLERGLWVGHTPAYREFTSVDRSITASAEAAGLRKHVLKLAADSHGREVFEIFRFER
jgi:4-amino-4-deoxy-L-arabinose transferase-like glycosyltransferase